MPPHIWAYPILGIVTAVILSKVTLLPNRTRKDRTFSYFVLFAMGLLWPLTLAGLLIVGGAVSWQLAQEERKANKSPRQEYDEYDDPI